ncbi:MAG: lytic transglycosylase domain-containing protein [Campylobacterales bacterium]
MRYLLLILPFLLYANEISLEFIKSKPAGIERDFYIWEYLKSAKKGEKGVEEAYNLSQYKNGYTYKEYIKKTTNKQALEDDICKGLRVSKLIDEDSECINIGLSYADMLDLTKNQKLDVAKKLETINPKKAEVLKFLASNNIRAFIKNYPNAFLYAFRGSSEGFRKKHLDIEFSKDELANLQDGYSLLTVIKIVTQNDYPNLQRAFLNAPINNLDRPQSAFFLGLNALKLNDEKRAKEFWAKSKSISERSYNKNRADFWTYQIDKNTKHLENICSRNHFDIYSLYAKESLGGDIKCYNILTSFPTKNTEAAHNIEDPFLWTKLKELSRDSNLAQSDLESLFTLSSLPHYAFLKRKIDNYKHEHFIMPYQDAFLQYEPNRSALLYSIGKQESLFIPSAISMSFALGMMQIMPFNIEAIAKQRGESVELTDAFDYKLNLTYSNHLVENLVKRFKHPLFVAYAYNGGGGFTGRMLKGDIFKSGKYEPFMSIEMVPITETREYGKEVLANYVIYYGLLGKKTTLKEQLANLLEPR